MIIYPDGKPVVQCDTRGCPNTIPFNQRSLNDGWKIERGDRVGVDIFHTCPKCAAKRCCPLCAQERR